MVIHQNRVFGTRVKYPGTTKLIVYLTHKYKSLFLYPQSLTHKYKSLFQKNFSKDPSDLFSKPFYTLILQATQAISAATLLTQETTLVLAVCHVAAHPALRNRERDPTTS
jgi:hypothetical protein